MVRRRRFNYTVDPVVIATGVEFRRDFGERIAV